MIGETAPAERSARHADDLAMVMHSSGTTSAPKGIAHSSNTMRYATEALCRRWELTGDDIYLVVCEFGFVGGLIFGYFPVLLNGAHRRARQPLGPGRRAAASSSSTAAPTSC